MYPAAREPCRQKKGNYGVLELMQQRLEGRCWAGTQLRGSMCVCECVRFYSLLHLSCTVHWPHSQKQKSTLWSLLVSRSVGSVLLCEAFLVFYSSTKQIQSIAVLMLYYFRFTSNFWTSVFHYLEIKNGESVPPLLFTFKSKIYAYRQ